MPTSIQPRSPEQSLVSTLARSPSRQVAKRKWSHQHAHSNHMTVRSVLFSCENSFESPLKASSCYPSLRKKDFDDSESSRDDYDKECHREITFSDIIHESSPHAKKSKIHRVSSMSQLPKHLSADDFLPANTMAVSTVAKLVNRMNKSASTPSLPGMVDGRSTVQAQSNFAKTNPDEFFQSLLQSRGISPHTHEALELEGYFIKPTEAHTAAYGSDVIRAVREKDVNALRNMHLNGRTLQCCNSFGESILHMACRHGDLDIVRLLVNEANVSLRVCDDFGRTPLHDAFWTLKPETELVKLIISHCPDLLLVKDKRGFTPLTYARRDHWGEWCEFLQENNALLTPRVLCG